MKVGDIQTIEGKKYRVIGIDTYSLKSFSGKNKNWKSYTLRGGDGSRKWFVKPILGKSWLVVSARGEELNGNLMGDYSGLAQIDFQGERGFSTPESLLLLFENKGKIYGVEKFAGDAEEIYYFKGSIFEER